MEPGYTWRDYAGVAKWVDDGRTWPARRRRTAGEVRAVGGVDRLAGLLPLLLGEHDDGGQRTQVSLGVGGSVFLAIERIVSTTYRSASSPRTWSPSLSKVVASAERPSHQQQGARACNEP